MFQRALSGSGGGGGALSKVATFDWSNITKTNTTLSVDLSSVSGVQAFALFENFIPVLKGVTIGGGGGSINQFYSWSYDTSTHILTMTLSGDTGYINFNPNGAGFGIDIYAI